MKVQKNDVIQVISHIEDSVVGCLLQVDEVRDDFVQAVLKIPYKGVAYFRVAKTDFIVIGTAELGYYDDI